MRRRIARRKQGPHAGWRLAGCLPGLAAGWFLAGSMTLALAQFRVETVIPAEGDSMVDPYKGIAVLFNRPPDPTTLVRDSAVTVTGTISGRIEGTTTFPDSLLMLFTPVAAFAAGEHVLVRLDPRIRSVDGDFLAGPFERRFRIAPPPTGDLEEDPDSAPPRTIIAPRYFFSSEEDPELAYEVLIGKAEDLISGRFGVDVMDVSSYKVGSRSTAAIRTGWVVNPRTQVAVVNEVRGSTPRTRFLLEYRLSEHVQLVLTQGGGRGEGVDLVWSRDY